LHLYYVFFFQGHPSLHLTHVTFSPDGSEVLLSYSGEHVYLMNVNHGKTILHYTLFLDHFLLCVTL